MMNMANLIVTHHAIEMREDTPTALQRQIDMIKAHSICERLLSTDWRKVFILIHGQRIQKVIGLLNSLSHLCLQLVRVYRCKINQV